MNSSQVGGVIRIVLTFLLGPLITKGWIDGSTISVLSGAIVTIGMVAWSVWEHRQAGLVKAAADIHPGMKVLIPQQLADSNEAICQMTSDPNMPQVMLKPTAAATSSPL